MGDGLIVWWMKDWWIDGLVDCGVDGFGERRRWSDLVSTFPHTLNMTGTAAEPRISLSNVSGILPPEMRRSQAKFLFRRNI
jgi:hypothetical protein